ncbi:hypothetical protein PBI_INGRID_6 [Arthrobacter phage Ingrid]|nr:hypothetical protein PBI_INGRID_6 [Arthrobacter phage Ingrid]QFG10988.1 hypothetical protein PBI_LORETTA_6 [Arthrobacter phage Loretta]
MTKNNSDNFLEHYGIKGMRWGRRRASSDDGSSSTSSVKATPIEKPKASADASAVSTYKSRVAAGGVDALSTKELQQLVNRQNLEQQYERLNPAPMAKGQKFMTETLPTLISVGSTAKSAYNVFYPAKEPPPPSTDLRVMSGKQKAGDMVLHLGKQLVKEHGMTIGKMALDAMMSK